MTSLLVQINHFQVSFCHDCGKMNLCKTIHKSMFHYGFIFMQVKLIILDIKCFAGELILKQRHMKLCTNQGAGPKNSEKREWTGK